jgi:hypothetical protein
MGSSTIIPPLLTPATALADGTLTKVPRTLTAIDASIQAARLAAPELSALTAPSSTTSIYRLLERSVAAAIWVFEGMLTRFQADIAELVNGAPVGTLKWYVDRALEFQAYTDLTTLVAKDNRVQYSPIDLTKRLITRAAAAETGNKVTLKVAKDLAGTAGGLQRLTDAERQQVLAYFDRLRPAGIQLDVVSTEADRLRVAGSVYYNPLLSQADVQAGVQAAIAGYLAALPFNGLLLVSRLEDAIQAVPGVTDVSLTAVQARVGTTVKAPFARAYYAEAGYIVLEDSAPAVQLSKTLAYYPQDGTTMLVI